MKKKELEKIINTIGAHNKSLCEVIEKLFNEKFRLENEVDERSAEIKDLNHKNTVLRSGIALHRVGADPEQALNDIEAFKSFKRLGGAPEEDEREVKPDAVERSLIRTALSVFLLSEFMCSCPDCVLSRERSRVTINYLMTRKAEVKDV